MKLTKEEQLIKQKKNNVKLFPIYKAISWDLLFYFPILFLFLTQTKGFSASGVLFADAFYTLSNTFWQIPITRFVDRIGKKNCLIIGNFLSTISIFAIIFMQQYYQLLIIQFIYALGFSMKGICESNILYDSLPGTSKRGSIFSKIDAKSSSNFYLVDAVASVIAGFAFAINGYIPLVLCFLFCLASTVLSFRFRHTTILENKVETVSLQTYLGQLKESFTFFMRSKRMKSLVIFNAVVMGLLFGITNLRSSILKDLFVPEQYFGIIFAILQLVAAISSRQTDNIQNVFKNKTLAFITLPVTISCILVGFFGKVSNIHTSIILIFLMFVIQYAIKGPFQGLMSRYLNNFTNRKIRPKISALKNLTSNLFIAGISLICALLLEFTETANIFIIIGCITTILVVLMLDYMRDKVGLKPEEYSPEDIKYSLNRPEKS